MPKVRDIWRLVTKHLNGMKPIEKLQIVIAILVTIMFFTSAVIATFDGTEALKAMTPLMTLMFGWIFASRITGAGG